MLNYLAALKQIYPKSATSIIAFKEAFLVELLTITNWKSFRKIQVVIFAHQKNKK
jgi:hypothetical protein